eukprot:TRINITY_DN11716_c0_g1_i1.p1 TRINITY_DN11716_c0_g1~~TRINITY_DN11716_c0_g1_i1.p1  ORF type:complete len:573 (-),score=148.60 TRINITY_DN11716_c0_g1_i1:45-1763(-)
MKAYGSCYLFVEESLYSPVYFQNMYYEFELEMKSSVISSNNDIEGKIYCKIGDVNGLKLDTFEISFKQLIKIGKMKNYKSFLLHSVELHPKLLPGLTVISFKVDKIYCLPFLNVCSYNDSNINLISAKTCLSIKINDSVNDIPIKKANKHTYLKAPKVPRLKVKTLPNYKNNRSNLYSLELNSCDLSGQLRTFNNSGNFCHGVEATIISTVKPFFETKALFNLYIQVGDKFCDFTLNYKDLFLSEEHMLTEPHVNLSFQIPLIPYFYFHDLSCKIMVEIIIDGSIVAVDSIVPSNQTSFTDESEDVHVLLQSDKCIPQSDAILGSSILSSTSTGSLMVNSFDINSLYGTMTSMSENEEVNFPGFDHEARNEHVNKVHNTPITAAKMNFFDSFETESILGKEESLDDVWSNINDIYESPSTIVNHRPFLEEESELQEVFGKYPTTDVRQLFEIISTLDSRLEKIRNEHKTLIKTHQELIFDNDELKTELHASKKREKYLMSQIEEMRNNLAHFEAESDDKIEKLEEISSDLMSRLKESQKSENDLLIKNEKLLGELILLKNNWNSFLNNLESF